MPYSLLRKEYQIFSYNIRYLYNIYKTVYLYFKYQLSFFKVDLQARILIKKRISTNFPLRMCLKRTKKWPAPTIINVHFPNGMNIPFTLEVCCTKPLRITLFKEVQIISNRNVINLQRDFIYLNQLISHSSLYYNDKPSKLNTWQYIPFQKRAYPFYGRCLTISLLLLPRCRKFRQ